MEEKNKLTAERSLEIIAEQIERSRSTISKNSSTSLISWGFCVFVFALLIAYLWKHHGGPVWTVLWAVMWFVGYFAERLSGIETSVGSKVDVLEEDAPHGGLDGCPQVACVHLYHALGMQVGYHQEQCHQAGTDAVIHAVYGC